MEEDVRLELFTVQQVRTWLKTGKGERGLSDEIISRPRAWSIIHNPYATDDLNIVSAIFVNDEVAAYTHLFPDENLGQRIYWNTTLYCKPKYEGRGYSAIVIGQFCELYGEHYFDLDAVEASIANLKFCGLEIDYVPQYILSDKSINGRGLRPMLARLKERVTKALHGGRKLLEKNINSSSYHIKYTSFVNDNVYAFIKEHSNTDVFLRTQGIFNWILQYPLMQDSPLVDRVERDSQFSSTKRGTHLYGIEVYKQEKLIGFYILNISTKDIDLSYLYYDNQYESEVFLSVAEHIVYFQVSKVMTSNEKFWNFMRSYKLYSKHSIRMKSFSHPKDFIYDKSKYLQSGDGDNLT